MHLATFYSYKGGVGRTMALVNVACELAQRGKKVLLIDFDLEAPGLSTYEQLAVPHTAPGVVDYVNEYLNTNMAPDVRSYIVSSTVTNVDGQEWPLWVMPAGQRDKTYTSRLATIDWQHLYAHRSGFLLFEDLKEQIARLEQKIDYVLVDSRTGHTDVGGICTRQLPDTIVILFVPNEQNIAGLETILADVRAEADRTSRRPTLLFCPSNVPFLDDEDEILDAQMNSAMGRLRFSSPAATLHRYDSLALLDQTIFSVARPRTRLAEEYRCLATALVKNNLEDRDGALASLDEIVRGIGRRGQIPGRSGALKSMSDVVEKVKILHPNDGKIAFTLASVMRALGDVEGTLDALGIAIDCGYRLPSALMYRAFASLGSKRDSAQADLRRMLTFEDTSAVDVSSAIELLRAVDPEGWADAVKKSPAIEHFGPEDQLAIARLLISDDVGVSLAEAITRRVIAQDPSLEEGKTELSLILIRTGRFGDAMVSIASDRMKLLDHSRRINDVFNYAMAQWGETTKPPADLLEKVARLAKDDPGGDANFSQCMALVHFLLGNLESAQESLDEARRILGPGHSFTCWRYLRVDRQEMEEDLNQLERMIRGEEVIPEFLQRHRHRHSA